ncbi:unnamed protein product [Closterium sp. NIES-65]|nr:unnamed protein product [Closterium sp. NIES-65]CAI5954221.1 unnamed protein product [Closterium sp. NIES-65]
MKRLCNDDDTGFSIGTGAAHTGTCEGLSARQLPDIGAVDPSAVRSLLLRAADSQTCQQQCESSTIDTRTLGALPALDWPLSFSTSLSSSFASTLAPSLSTSFTPSFSPSLAPSVTPNHVSTSRPYEAQSLPAGAPWRSTTRTPFTFGLTQSSRVLHSAPPSTLPPSAHSTVPPTNAPPFAPFTAPPHNPLTSPPSSFPSHSSHFQSSATFTPTSFITPATPLVPSDPPTILNRGPPHSLPSFPSLSALHNAASSASVDYSPPSSQTSSQPSFQHTSVHTRPHKAPRMSRGVLPPAALEFARSFFSGLPGRDGPQGGESSDGQQMLERTCTSARECLLSAKESLASAQESLTSVGQEGGGKEGTEELPPMACQPSLSDMVTAAAAAAAAAPGAVSAPAVTGTPDVADTPAAVALAAAAEGICQGELSIWNDLIELEGGAEGVVCGVEKRAGLAVSSFCELEDLLEENSKLL